jgi:hypothetical protein
VPDISTVNLAVIPTTEGRRDLAAVVGTAVQAVVSTSTLHLSRVSDP